MFVWPTVVHTWIASIKKVGRWNEQWKTGYVFGVFFSKNPNLCTKSLLTCYQWPHCSCYRQPFTNGCVYEIQKFIIRMAHVKVRSFRSIDNRPATNSKEVIEIVLLRKIDGFLKAKNVSKGTCLNIIINLVCFDVLMPFAKASSVKYSKNPCSIASALETIKGQSEWCWTQMFQTLTIYVEIQNKKRPQ